jgi:hypothetical protein
MGACIIVNAFRARATSAEDEINRRHIHCLYANKPMVYLNAA